MTLRWSLLCSLILVATGLAIVPPAQATHSGANGMIAVVTYPAYQTNQIRRVHTYHQNGGAAASPGRGSYSRRAAVLLESAHVDQAASSTPGWLTSVRTRMTRSGSQWTIRSTDCPAARPGQPIGAPCQATAPARDAPTCWKPW